MQEKFYIVFRNSKTNNTHTLYLTPTGHALSKFWMDTLKSNFIGPHNASNSRPLNKQYMFYGWVNDWNDDSHSRNLRTVCEELNTAIAKVNFYYIPHDYPKIELAFNPEKLQDGNWYREAMNELHHHFEVLIGQVGNTSEWYYKPESQVATYYVQQLNSLLHEIESIVNNINTSNDESGVLLNYTIPHPNGSWDPQPIRYDLTQEHYDCFTDIKHKWGLLVAYYSQLGKQHIEVYADGDDVIGEDNISGIQYMLGESILSLTDNTEDLPRLTPEYKAWLTDNGFDYTDPTLALGLGVLATVDGEREEHDPILKQMDDIVELGFCIGTYKTAYCTYTYMWPDYQKQLVESLEANDNSDRD